jgi:DNA-3-methyladenine glycosylase I
MLKDGRCFWCSKDEEYIHYHDTEWGVPVYEDQKLFEFLVLETAQAGLSWHTILKRRKNYQNAFCQFDVNQVARMTEKDVLKQMENTGIIRNRAKIEATIANAKAFLQIQEDFGSFSLFQWQFVDGEPKDNAIKTRGQIQATTAISDWFTHELKSYGFKFVGSTVVYAHMQASGMVNDHFVDCFRYDEVKKLSL